MKQPSYKVLLAAALLMWHCSVPAEDIDLFVDSPSSADLPNVLFILDNTANWTQAFNNEITALKAIFNGLPTGSGGAAKFNIGVMFAAETSSADNNVQGGYVRAAMRPMTSANIAKYSAMFGALDVGKDKGNSGQSSLMMAEAYRYFSAGTPYSGNFKAKADYRGNTAADWSSSATSDASKAAMQAIYALPGNALSSKFATTYVSPISSGCAKNFIIYISNGPSQDSNSVITQATTMLAAAGGNTTTIPLTPTGSQSNVSDEWARFMHVGTTMEVVTYTIGVDIPTSGQGPGWERLLKSMADQSEGKYAAANSGTNAGQEISAAVNKALSEIQAVNSVFASVSLPVSVNTQGTFLNQVFVGMFRPDAGAFPRWAGNLKQYKLGLISNGLHLEDADANLAINSDTGFVTECARSFWTPTTPDSYWAFKPQGECIPPASLAADAYRKSNFPDGSVVEKGAQGFQLRSSNASTRRLKTCSPAFASCTGSLALTDFVDGNAAITQGLLGAADPTERTALINWARGSDVDDENHDTSSALTETRASAHGDVVHSRPVAVDFGSGSTPKVVVFYGDNDGILHAVNGNRTDAIGSIAAGNELWSFIPPEFYGQIKRLRDDTTQISFPNITTGSPLPKPYGIDGAITALKDNSKAWIYAGMRRGGRALYAFNVDLNDPSNITLKWKIGCPNNFPASGAVSDVNCTTGLTGLGQTWSPAKVFKAAGYSSGNAPLIVTGGGYDTCEDANPNTCTVSTKGNKIYVMDADTGALQTTLTTDRSVIADVVIVPDATTGLAKFAYAVDLGGNIYRVNIGTDAPAAWTMVKIASLGCDSAASCAANRKFMFAPDVLVNGSGYILLLGSGDREKPRLTNNTVNNYFFMVEDQPMDGTWLSSETGNCGSAVICRDSLLGIAATDGTPSSAALAAKKGWYLGLASTEQVVTSAITIFGVVNFSTHTPSAPLPGSCSSNLGTARVYNLSFANAAPENGTNKRYLDLPDNIGLPPSPVAGMVTLDDGRMVPFCIGCSSDSPLEATEPEPPATGAPAQTKRKVYWYIQR